MTRRIEISSSQLLNPTGVLGAWMFVCSPLVDAAVYWWFVRELARGESLFLPTLGLIICTVACLAGLVMVIVGREQHYTVREVDPHPTKRPVDPGPTKRLWTWE